MRRLFASLALSAFVLMSCASGDPDRCEIVTEKVPSPPVSTIKSYQVVIHKDVPTEQVGPIFDAALEWVSASRGAIAIEVSYAEFEYKLESRPNPPVGQIWVYTQEKADKTSNTIGFCWSWGDDVKGRPVRARIWLQNDLSPRTFYLTALHEFGHAFGLPHHEPKTPPSIMFPFITDVGDHPTCVDHKALCERWECDPGC
jgi:hypothetical protein